MPRTLQRSRLDGAVPRTALPVIFLPIRVDPRRQRHQKPAAERVQIRLVEGLKFRQPFGHVRTVVFTCNPETHAMLSECRPQTS